LVDITPPSWGIDTLFRDEDRLDLFCVFNKEMKSHSNDATLRAAGISLYWFLSRFCPTYTVPSGYFDDDTGEYIESSGSVPDYSEEWKPYRREFQGYLARLVRLVNVRDCVDWHRTLWEIHNCCAARDWDLARKLFAHAAEQNQCPAPELNALRAYFEYRVIFGPDIDSRLGLGTDNPIEPKWDVQPYWESVRREFGLLFELSLDALAVPLDHLCSEELRSSEGITGDTVLLEFIWGALQDKSPLLTLQAGRSLGSAIIALNKVLDTLGPNQDIYRSILAQCLEVLGSNTGAAEAYSTLALRQKPFEGLRSRPLFALKAAKLYLKDGETGKAEEVLESARASYPDHIRTLQELLKLKAARGGDLREADSLAERLRKLTKEKDWTLETRLFMSMRQSIVPQSDVDNEIAKRDYYSRLGPFAKGVVEAAVRHELSADENQKMKDSNLRIVASCYSQAVESELLEKIFKPFRLQVLKSGQRDQLTKKNGKRDDFLDAFIDRYRQPSFRQMIISIEWVPMVTDHVQQHFPRLLVSAMVEKTKKLVRLRNAVSHPRLTPQEVSQARALAESIIEAMN
jgi:hypothetical protein